MAEYAIANKIVEEPMCIWWANDALRKHHRMSAKGLLHFWKWAHKFSVSIPKLEYQALQLDDEPWIDLWKKAIKEEMENVMPPFEFLEQDNNVRIGYQNINCHVIFDVKMDFTW